jgi:hypothetical protein
MVGGFVFCVTFTLYVGPTIASAIGSQPRTYRASRLDYGKYCAVAEVVGSACLMMQQKI